MKLNFPQMLLLLASVSLLSSFKLAASNDNIRFKRYSQQQGLSQEAVFDILQDDQGYLWFATQEGLNRFDGIEFKTFYHDSSNNHSLSNDAIYTMALDHQGQIWLGTNGGGVNRFDPKTEQFQHYQSHTHHLSSNRVNVVFVDHKGVLWVGTDDAGLNRFNPFKQRFEVFRHQANDPSSISNDTIRAISQDQQGQLWIGTDKGLNLFHSQIASFSQLDALKHHSIRTILADNQSRLWVGSYQNPLVRIDADGTLNQYQQCHTRVRDLLEDNRNNIWIATDSGLCQYQDQSNSFIQFEHDKQDLYSIGDNRGLSLFQDRGNVLWLGTFGGINKWQYSNFEHHRLDANNPEGLSSNIVTAFSQAPDGKVWVGSYDGLNLYDPQSKQTSHYPIKALSDKRIMSLHHDQFDRLWIGTRGQGLFQYDIKTQKVIQHQYQANNPNSISGNGITAIFEDQQGQIWVAAYGDGLNLYHPKLQQFSRFNHSDNDKILAIHQTQDGLLYLGTEGDGLYQFDPSNHQFTRFELNANVAWSISEDKKGDLWIATWGGGINRWQQKDRQAAIAKFDNFGKKQGLPSGTIYNIITDNNQLWLSSNRGLIRFNPTTKQVKRFDHSHGLQGNEFNLGAAIKTTKNQLMFGGSNGFNAFYASKITSNPHQPQVVLTGIQKLNKKTGTVDVSKQLQPLEFGYQDYAISFDFAGLDFSAPAQNRYRYMLEGFDQHWIDLGHTRRTTFTNLPADEYIFRVQAANNDGLWSETGLAIKVRITPPPWQTWWAYTLYALLVLSIIYAYLRHQNNKLAEKARYSKHLENQVALRTQELTIANQAKGTFIATMSHELRTPMTAIIGFTESIYEDLHKHQLDQNECEHRLSKILRNANHLLQLMNDILDISKIEVKQLAVESIAVKPSWLLQEVDELIGLQAKQKGLSFTIDYQYPIPKYINTDPTRLKQILLNLCNNAIKFTENGAITIKVSTHNNQLHFSVNDTGIGIAKDKQKSVFDAFSQADSSTTRKFGGTGLGLSISKQLCEAMGGQMQLQSTLNQGSEFSFYIPIDANINDWLEDKNTLEQFCQQRNQSDFSVPNLTGHILLAEDWADNQELIQMYVERTGAKITIVENGELAVEKALIENFDMILMDVQMPVVDGIEATQVLRATGFSKPIIALTANVSSTDIEQYLTHGFTSHLSKPIERQAFYQCLADILPSGNAQIKQQQDDSEYLDLVANFIAKLPKIMQQIEQAVDNKDWHQLQALVHNLKGLGGSFGFPQLTELADPMYNALEMGDPESAVYQLEQLKQAAEQVQNIERAA